MTESATATMPPVVPFTFRYWLDAHGWADGVLRRGDLVVTLTASYLSDALRDLLFAVDKMLDGQLVSEATWEEEPGSYRWSFENLDDSARMRVLAGVETRELEQRIRLLQDFEVREVDEGHGRELVLFEVEAKPEQIAAAIVDGASDVFAREGEVSYYEKWQAGIFPLPLLNSIEERIGRPKTPEPDPREPEFDPTRDELVRHWDRFLNGEATSDSTGRWLARQPRYFWSPVTTIVRLGLNKLEEQVKLANHRGAVDESMWHEYRAWSADLAAYDEGPMQWYRARSMDRLRLLLESVPAKRRLGLVRDWESKVDKQGIQQVLDSLGLTWAALEADLRPQHGEASNETDV